MVLVADFGGGTSDFSILQMGPEDLHQDDVLGLSGISLAGDAYDGSIMKHKISAHFGTHVSFKMPMGRNVMPFPKFLLAKLNSPADISFLARKDTAELLKNIQNWSIGAEDQRHLSQLMALADEGLGYAIYRQIEHSKKELSSLENSLFQFHNQAGIHIEETLLQSDFLHFSNPITEKIIHTLTELMKHVGIKSSDIDLVCLTGGTAQMKSIKQSLTTLFGEEKIKQFRFFHSIINGLAEKAKELAQS